MSLRVRCRCGEALTVPGRLAGLTVACVACERQIAIPPVLPSSNPDSPPPLDRKQGNSQTLEKSRTEPATPDTTTFNSPAPPPLSVSADHEASTTQKKALPKPFTDSGGAALNADDAAESILGIEHDLGKKWNVYQLGICVALLGAVGMYPAVQEVMRHYQDFDSRGIERWAYFVFFCTGLQLVYALYMVQLPDWSTTWVVMIVCSIASMMYAMGMGVSLMAREDNQIIGTLGLSPMHSAGHLSLWCFMMMLLTSLLTYFMVRTSLRWKRTFELATAGQFE